MSPAFYKCRVKLMRSQCAFNERENVFCISHNAFGTNNDNRTGVIACRYFVKWKFVSLDIHRFGMSNFHFFPPEIEMFLRHKEYVTSASSPCKLLSGDFCLRLDRTRVHTGSYLDESGTGIAGLPHRRFARGSSFAAPRFAQ